MMDHLQEAHYFHLPSQGNIYTLTDLKLANGSNKILVASLKRDIFYLECLDNTQNTLIPTAKEVSFTYIPNSAEIISIDAFNKSSKKNEFVIGITIIKSTVDSHSQYLESFLNIYTEPEESDDFDIESISQNCLNVELNFIPYKLLHTELVIWENQEVIKSKETVFVLSGSDNLVHFYREDPISHIFKEIDQKTFPEFSTNSTASPVIAIDFKYIQNYSKRISTFATESGYVKLMVYDVINSSILYNFSTTFANIISDVKLFSNQAEQNPFNSILLPEEVESNEINLVITNTTLPAVAFHNVLKHGLSNYFPLPKHCSTSILTCSLASDIDFDGCKEIIIGNNSEELMFYKWTKENYRLEVVKKLAAPIVAAKYIDISGDGVNELIVLTKKGVHILQHDSQFVQSTIESKLKSLMEKK